MNWNKKEFKLYDDKDAVDIQQTHALLSQTYWASNRPRIKVEKLIEHSTCFSLFRGDEQVGFVRVVSDFTATSWVADMIVKESCQGLGLGYWMMKCVMSHPKFEHTQFALQTKDAHPFYEKLGFAQRETLMSTDASYL